MVIANLVHRDFENEIRQFGDVVNTRRPGTFQIRRKADGDPLAEPGRLGHQRQGAVGPVVLHQLHHQGRRGQQVVPRPGGHLPPAGHDDDRPLGGPRRLGPRPRLYLGRPRGQQRVGRLGNLSADNSKDYVLEAREQLNINKAPLEGRNLVLAPVSETALLKNELFIAAQMRGDFGTALESATLGRILGFDTYMDQNVNSVSLANCDVDATGTVTNALAAGSGGSQAVTLADYAVNIGEFAVVAGNDQPTYITAATTGSGATTAITLNEVNKYATAASAAVDGLQGVRRRCRPTPRATWKGSS